MHATIIGGGRIGRGFIASLLQRNNIEKDFMDISEELLNLFNSHKNYNVHILGNKNNNTIIENFKAENVNDEEALRKELLKSKFIFTAVGGKNLKLIGTKIGKQYRHLLEEGMAPSFVIITCENWLTPASDLQKSILEELNEEQKNIFLNKVDVTQGVIRASGTSAPKGEETENLLDTWMQDYWVLPVDQSRIKNNAIPQLKYFDFKEDFGEMLAQKIYTNNTSVALVGYLGYLKGYNYVAESANDFEIETIFKKCFTEINHALVYSLDVSEESQKEFSEIAEAKYKDYKIVDHVVRIAREPLRKLSPDDRFIGPAKMAQEAGITPKAISLGAAAALYFDYYDDAEAMKLQTLRKQKGLEYVLDTVCGLQDNRELKELILESVNQLKLKGWIKGDVTHD
ncbi:hypothetical protein ACS127_07400 [Amphibacillus sp. Q70]|uniref:mannitol dehydrogenase family protein n=1 Tax=Amphibacillus sp. Q70 TaxID=3453416 RepID=UPI003F855168